MFFNLFLVVCQVKNYIYMKVLKFGGFFVVKLERICSIVDIFKLYYVEGEYFMVVFFVFGGVMDMFIKMSEMVVKG